MSNIKYLEPDPKEIIFNYEKNQTLNMHIKLEKGLRNREEEDQIISYAMIKLLLIFNSPNFEIQDIDYSKFLDIKLSANETINLSKIQEKEYNNE